MASSDKPIYQFTEGVVAEDTLFPISYQANGEYKTGNISAQALGENLSNNFTNNSLNTSNKTLIGGINELLDINDQIGVSVKGTLDAGETELVLESSYIKEDSLLDFYTSIFGVNPTTVETEEGSITLTFPAQETDLDVEVIIRGGISKDDQVIFEKGQWYKSDVFNVVLSQTGAEDISIVDGNLVYNGTTGFSISPIDTSKRFWIGLEFYSPSSTNYSQSGRCAIGADAKRCQNEGYQRYSQHDLQNVPANQPSFFYDSLTQTGTALFFSGSNKIITKIIGGIYPNVYSFVD